MSENKPISNPRGIDKSWLNHPFTTLKEIADIVGCQSPNWRNDLPQAVRDAVSAAAQNGSAYPINRVLNNAESLARSACTLLDYLSDRSCEEDGTIKPDERLPDYTHSIRRCVHEFRKRHARYKDSEQANQPVQAKVLTDAAARLSKALSEAHPREEIDLEDVRAMIAFQPSSYHDAYRGAREELLALQKAVDIKDKKIAELEKQVKQHDADAEMYARAWERELCKFDGKIFNKRHHIDALVLTTQDLVKKARQEGVAAALSAAQAVSDQFLQIERMRGFHNPISDRFYNKLSQKVEENAIAISVTLLRDLVLQMKAMRDG